MESSPSEPVNSSCGEDVDAELEELTWHLMEKTGFLSDLKSRILNFVEKNGNVEDQAVTVIPERANPYVLQLVYSYLDWLGMKYTCEKLLVEAPVPIRSQTAHEDKSDEPLLHKMFRGKGGLRVPSPENLPKLNSTYSAAGNVNEAGPVTSVTDKEPHNECEPVSPKSAPQIEKNELTNDSAKPTTSKEEIFLTESESSGAKTEDLTLHSNVNGTSAMEHVIQFPIDIDKDPMSSIEEDSSMISDLSVELNTEDVSLPSNANGMSSAEYEVKLS